MPKAPLLECVVFDLDWNTPRELQTQASKLVNERAVFTGLNKNGQLVWECELCNCTEAELVLVRILLSGYIVNESVCDQKRRITAEF